MGHGYFGGDVDASELCFFLVQCRFAARLMMSKIVSSVYCEGDFTIELVGVCVQNSCITLHALQGLNRTHKHHGEETDTETVTQMSAVESCC